MAKNQHPSKNKHLASENKQLPQMDPNKMLKMVMAIDDAFNLQHQSLRKKPGNKQNLRVNPTDSNLSLRPLLSSDSNHQDTMRLLSRLGYAHNPSLHIYTTSSSLTALPDAREEEKEEKGEKAVHQQKEGNAEENQSNKPPHQKTASHKKRHRKKKKSKDGEKKQEEGQEAKAIAAEQAKSEEEVEKKKQEETKKREEEAQKAKVTSEQARIKKRAEEKANAEKARLEKEVEEKAQRQREAQKAKEAAEQARLAQKKKQENERKRQEEAKKQEENLKQKKEQEAKAAAAEQTRLAQKKKQEDERRRQEEQKALQQKKASEKNNNLPKAKETAALLPTPTSLPRPFPPGFPPQGVEELKRQEEEKAARQKRGLEAKVVNEKAGLGMEGKQPPSTQNSSLSPSIPPTRQKPVKQTFDNKGNDVIPLIPLSRETIEADLDKQSNDFLRLSQLPIKIFCTVYNKCLASGYVFAVTPPVAFIQSLLFSQNNQMVIVPPQTMRAPIETEQLINAHNDEVIGNLRPFIEQFRCTYSNYIKACWPQAPAFFPLTTIFRYFENQQAVVSPPPSYPPLPPAAPPPPASLSFVPVSGYLLPPGRQQQVVAAAPPPPPPPAPAPPAGHFSSSVRTGQQPAVAAQGGGYHRGHH